MIVKPGATDVTTYFHLRLAADGTDATGLTITDIDLQYVRSGAAPSTKADATALAATDSAHADNAAIEIDATDQPGVYRVDWPDAAFAAGVREVILTVKVATVFTESLRVQLQQVPADVTHWLGTAAATPTVAGVPEVDVTHFGGTAATTASGRPEVNTSHIGGTLQTANDVGADVDAILADTGTDGVIVATNNDKTGYGLADDAITAAKFDESTAFPLASADSGSTQVARTGADGDTLETLSDEIAVVDGNVDTLVSRITSTLFAGITSLAEWLGLLAGKQTGDATARTELRATGAGSGTFDETADSLEAVRDRGDAAWTTATTVDLNADQSGVTVGTVNALGTQAKADVNAEVDAAIETYHLDHLLAATYDPASKPGAADALLNELVENDGGVSRFTANALEEAPSGGATAADIADAVWEEAIADHSGTAGSTAEQLAAAGAAGDPWATALPGSYTSGQAGKIVGDNLNATVGSRATQTSVDDLPTNAELATALDALPTAAENADAVLDEAMAGHTTAGTLGKAVSDTLADTNELQGDWADGGRLDLILDARASQTSVDDLPTNAELATALGNLNDLDASDVRAAIGLASANLDTQLDALPTAAENASQVRTELTTELGRIDAAVSTRAPESGGNVAAIKAKTDNLPEGIKKNQALADFEFLMVDSADHVTGKTGLTVTATRSIDGGAFAACANSPVEVASGVYAIDLAAADTNGTVITYRFTASGADDTTITVKTST